MATEVRNKKAEYRYFLLEEFTAGLVLTGSEIKSIRAGKVNIAEAYCRFRGADLMVINMSIAHYSNAGYAQHEERRERKLLLQRTELNKIRRKLKDSGVTVVPIVLFISEKGWAKLRIALARGKHAADKREDVKKKDLKREMARGQAG